MTATKALVKCTTCGGEGTVPRAAGVTMDGEPVGDVNLVKSELWPATCNRCNGSGMMSGTAPEEG
jgi:DnaJ-class molecular chaperone